MLCDICQRPATGQCSGCGSFLCADHGGGRCFRCAGAFAPVKPQVVEIPPDTTIYTTDKDSRHAGKGYLQCYTRPAMETIHIDDPEPPSCLVCRRLARHICSNCHQLFCERHRGGGDLCRRCNRSALLGLWILAAVLLLVVVLVILNL